MSIDIHSLMAMVDMTKLLQKSDSTNIQISDLVHAMAVSEPCLFGNSTANLMPVEYSDKVDITMCIAHINNWTPYDDDAQGGTWVRLPK